MKLLAITNLFGRPWDTTVGTFNQRIFEQINSRCELTLLVPIPWTEIVKFPKQYFAANSQQRKIWPFVHYFPYIYIPKLSQSLNVYFLLFSVIIFCPFIVLFRRWDAVIGSWIYPDGLVAVLLGKIKRIPALAVALGTDVNDLANRTKQRSQVRRILSQGTSTVTVSKDLANKLAALGIAQNKLHVILNGVDSNSFKPQPKSLAKMELGLNPSEKLVLFVGSHIPEKGCFELIKAFAQLTKLHSNCKLAMIGGGASALALQELVSQLNLDAKVTFLGKLNHDLLPSWFSAADALCLPSYREGIPNVIMEAMAAGLPVVATSVGGIPEVVTKETGVLIAPRDIESLLTGLSQVLSQQWNTTAIRASVRDYTWDATGRQYMQLINDAIVKHRY
jgi:glycosyltransferase involved in cell wall biosynthesis